MAGNLITTLLSLATNLLPSITATAQAPCSTSSNSNNSRKEHARAVEEDVERLMVILEGIKATLLAAEEREIRDHYVKHWLKEIKKVAYDAEDVLSEYRYEVTRVHVEARKASEASRSHKGKQMEYIVPISDDMVDRFKKIRSRFDEIAKDRDALQLRESDGVRRPNQKKLRPPTGHMVDEASIFGRGAEITKVINFLLSEKEKEKSFSVISIVGKGGLGKTTIAQLIYKDERVSRCFDLFGWVCVSEEFDVGRLIKATIESLSKMNYDLSELSPLQEELANGKRILLVLDDVWNENKSLWELFKVPFKEAKMVKILMTTRNKKVAEVMQTTACFGPTYLPEDSSWQLFQHYAFSATSDIVPTHIVDMGREIMRKCGGLPLAVKSIACLLRHETNEESWVEILESDLWKSNPSNDIFPALQISYAHLPAHLKPCFLLCSMYPKDYLLEQKHLVELWISHGYIESRGKKTKTEIGVEYYEELKERSFLDDSSPYFPNEYHCKLHDIIHDLARLISENEHYSVVSYQPLYINEVKVQQEVYHLYARGFNGCANQILQLNWKGLRTLLMDQVDHSEELEGILTKIESLRVLKLKGGFTEIPHSIFKLKHLTYLNIKSKYLKTLPLSIGLLYNIQTLILHCHTLEYLPECIGDLANLQFLKIESRLIKKLPKSLCSLINMVRLVIRSDYLEEVPSDLRDLSNLHELTICSDQTLALPNTIGCLSRLEELNFLSLHNQVNWLLGYVPHGLVSFPAIKIMAAGLIVKNIAWLKDMKALEGRLSIEGLKESNLVDAKRANLRNKCKLETLYLCWDYEPNYKSPLFGKLDLGLRLRLEACEGGLVGANDVDFALLECLQPHPNLKRLLLRCYPSATLPGWMRDPFSLQSIQQVSLEYCLNIQSLPFGRSLHTLKHLKIKECSNIRVVQLEQLPSQLEELHISFCNGLELITGLGHQDMLAALSIDSCRVLKSLKMNELQLVESTEPLGDSSHEKPHIGWQIISSLTTFIIENCNSLSVLPISNFHTLKHLRIKISGRIRVLQLEKLSHLEELHIVMCDQLEWITGLGNLNMLAVLEISHCSFLKFLMMDEMELLESTEPFGDSSHEVPHTSGQTNSSITKIIVKNCYSLFVLPISNFHTLKHLRIETSGRIRILQLEKLSQLEELHIVRCDQLELITGIGNLKMLDVLEISDCSSLKSLMWDELQLVEKPHIDRKSISSLTNLKITYCQLLCVLPYGLIPSGPCVVCIHHCGCPDLLTGHESDFLSIMSSFAPRRQSPIGKWDLFQFTAKLFGEQKN